MNDSTYQAAEPLASNTHKAAQDYLLVAAAVRELNSSSYADEFVISNKDYIAAYFDGLAVSQPNDEVSRIRLRTLLTVAPCLSSMLPA